MDIRARLYPYPVLTSYSDDYIDSEFTFDITTENINGEIKFNFAIILENKGLQDLIDMNNAEFIVHIECTQTCYRKILHINEIQFYKNIKENKLRGKVSVCLFIVAKNDLKNYTNDKFNSDYEGIFFDIDKGGILAIAGQYDVHVEKDIEDTSKIPSIFSICKYDDENGMNVNIHGDKIIIGLPVETFKNYKLLSNRNDMIPVFHAMIITPVLIYILEKLCQDMEEYEGYNWYRVIEKTFDKNGIEFTKEKLEEIPSYELVNLILANPIDRALNSIVSLDDGEED